MKQKQGLRQSNHHDQLFSLFPEDSWEGFDSLRERIKHTLDNCSPCFDENVFSRSSGFFHPNDTSFFSTILARRPSAYKNFLSFLSTSDKVITGYHSSSKWFADLATHIRALKKTSDISTEQKFVNYIKNNPIFDNSFLLYPKRGKDFILFFNALRENPYTREQLFMDSSSEESVVGQWRETDILPALQHAFSCAYEYCTKHYEPFFQQESVNDLFTRWESEKFLRRDGMKHIFSVSSFEELARFFNYNLSGHLSCLLKKIMYAYFFVDYMYCDVGYTTHGRINQFHLADKLKTDIQSRLLRIFDTKENSDSRTIIKGRVKSEESTVGKIARKPEYSGVNLSDLLGFAIYHSIDGVAVEEVSDLYGNDLQHAVGEIVQYLFSHHYSISKVTLSQTALSPHSVENIAYKLSLLYPSLAGKISVDGGVKSDATTSRDYKDMKAQIAFCTPEGQVMSMEIQSGDNPETWSIKASHAVYRAARLMREQFRFFHLDNLSPKQHTEITTIVGSETEFEMRILEFVCVKAVDEILLEAGYESSSFKNRLASALERGNKKLLTVKDVPHSSIQDIAEPVIDAILNRAEKMLEKSNFSSERYKYYLYGYVVNKIHEMYK